MLARPHGDARRVPSGLKITGEPRKISRAGWFRRRARRQTRLKFLDTAKSHFPGAFKLRDDEAIVRIAGGVATLGKRGVVAGLLQLQLYDASMFVETFHMHPLGLLRRFDRHRLHRAQELSGNSGLNTGSAESQAARETEHKVGSIAAIDRSSRFAADIAYRQAPSAAPAGEEAGE